MLTIDGSYGEGGGQILRSSLTLSLLTKKAVTLHNIRAGRQKPGLMRQHLACVEAAAKIGGAEIDGAKIGSQELCFRPKDIRGGEFEFAIGSAGSTMLLLQTVLLPLLCGAQEPSRLILQGGTHNPFAPPFDFIDRVFLPLLRRMGAEVSVKLQRCGFYPVGGGYLEVDISPSRLSSTELTERGELLSTQVVALGHGVPDEILLDESNILAELLGASPEAAKTRQVDSPGAGNALFAELRFAESSELFTAFGERGVSRRRVAEAVATEALAYLSSGAPIGEHLADQLLLPLAVAGGGRFATCKLTDHFESNRKVIESFMPIQIQTKQINETKYEVEVKS